MPYTIEIRRSAKRLQPGQSTFDRTAVATLDEARDIATIAVRSAEDAQNDPTRVGTFSEADERARTLPDAGGTIGPLPDGTVIEVRQVAPADLARMAGIRPHMFDPDNPVPLVAAFNAR